MAVNMQPVDGLIHRLLQQHGKPPAATPESHQGATRAHVDHVTFSTGTQDASLAEQAEEHAQKPGERALESHLLNLYRANDRLGG